MSTGARGAARKIGLDNVTAALLLEDMVGLDTAVLSGRGTDPTGFGSVVACMSVGLPDAIITITVPKHC